MIPSITTSSGEERELGSSTILSKDAKRDSVRRCGHGEIHESHQDAGVLLALFFGNGMHSVVGSLDGNQRYLFAQESNNGESFAF